ncbi:MULTISPECIES: MFS transporter [unclassified Mycoplasma]|uniref:MFS transporter n=1 Tax=unclassified Mycoplasma TaxID=2683645 RepID=UPI00211C85C6|nr:MULTISPECIES: MFS transporter [unclassified Mycoplasma]UUM20086.1 MFS transporter [Mycoplasma sp. 1578d]UUM25066.1 MFS transporter [Mycoplasma sp. 3686d]
MNNLEQTKTKDYSKQSIILWMIVMLGYLLFVVDWFIIAKVSGKPTAIGSATLNPGWSSSFFVASAGQIAAGATNWTITLLRVVGSILSGILVVKWGHRKAVIFMIAVMLLSFPILFIGTPLGGSNQLTLVRAYNPTEVAKASVTLTGDIAAKNPTAGTLLGPVADLNNGYLLLADGTQAKAVIGLDGKVIGTSTSIAGYALFIIFRTFVAVGGTTLIAYSQPIIATMKSDRTKSLLNNSNQWGFNGGVIVTFLPFLAVSFTTFAQTYWLAFVLGTLILIFSNLVVFFFLSRPIAHLWPQAKKPDDEKLDIKGLLSKKTTWKYISMFGIWLILVVIPLTGTYWNALKQISPIGFEKEITSGGLTFNSAFLGLVWVLGLLFGFSCIAAFAKTIYKRKAFLTLTYSASVFFLILVVITAATLGTSSVTGMTLIALFTFIGGGFAWGASGITLVLPHESKEIDKRYIALIFGFIWGFGYLIYTIFDASNTVIYDLGKNSALPLTDPHRHYIGATIGLTLFILVCSSVVFIIKKLPESYYNKDGQLVELTKTWRWNDWRFIVANKAKNRHAEILK